MTFPRNLILVAALALAALCGPVRAADPLAEDGTGNLGPWLAVARGTVDVDGGLMRLATQREGLIAEVFVKEGDRVSAGQILARLDDGSSRVQQQIAEAEQRQARAQLNAAELRLRHARAEVDRLGPLLSADAVPARQGDEATRAAETAEADRLNAEIALDLAGLRLESAQLETEARLVKAPVDGVILRSSARPGDGASTSNITEMFLLAPDGARVMRGTLDEQFIGKVSAGQTAQIVTERDANRQLSGHVLRVAPVFGRPGQAQTEARSVEIVIALDDADAGRLILGERLIARILP
ncbi:MAG: HlyD family efflux transporter periplasmic adaptor subunit [Paracoccus sp. (in: a-proteobacteria)]|nr:HlyD family efflux transporter periplasmic adaptor subunit [Paracoccus sp. (in: a-proteobacteria)]